MVAMSGSNSFVKEMTIRKRVSSIFNKREEDFPSLKEYNDYLEEVEDMTFNLIEGIDVDAIESNIAKYQEENADQIIIARARKAEELAAALNASKGPVQTETIDLGAGLGSHTTGTGLQGQYAPTTLPGAGILQPRPTGMVPQPLPIGGPSNHPHGYAVEDEEGMKLRAERAARAGGWTVDLSRKRALEEAFNSIWI
ncbi:hypothetical protein IEQ34_002799 [Dendrobium chrysotoxum]|uniref:MAT1 centre domain-containing protein n=1 Tax=Dendrobium chrysotoxum TaxID=161865 RepID=A0AAV7HGS2_DENCH|nr:hypothetical protein IEQ34_002799 [Dendrobium chrysotoxum]